MSVSRDSPRTINPGASQSSRWCAHHKATGSTISPWTGPEPKHYDRAAANTRAQIKNSTVHVSGRTTCTRETTTKPHPPENGDDHQHFKTVTGGHKIADFERSKTTTSLAKLRWNSSCNAVTVTSASSRKFQPLIRSTPSPFSRPCTLHQLPGHHTHTHTSRYPSGYGLSPGPHAPRHAADDIFRLFSCRSRHPSGSRHGVPRIWGATSSESTVTHDEARRRGLP